MAEITFKSAGIKTREIDLSQPARTGPVGVPAGIIGTAQEGPAFVPLTFANYNDFVTTFGQSDGKKFGPIAVNQWLANAQAVTYMRVLGAGDGKQRTSTGQVTNAGFTVGNRIVQGNGLIGDNVYATSGLDGCNEGRTYFLGCFMSESNGSTVFSDAGIQKTSVPRTAATATLSTVDNGNVAHGLTAGQKITLTSTDGTVVDYFISHTDDGGRGHLGVIEEATPSTLKLQTSPLVNASITPGATAIAVGFDLAGSNKQANVLQLLEQAILHANGHNGKIAVSSAPGPAAEIQSITLTQATLGHGGNRNTTSNLAKITISSDFSGGQDVVPAVPILRGVVLAPSGVILHLSGNAAQNGSDAPVKGNTAAASGVDLMGREGSLTGSLNLASQEFVMLMNGYNNTDTGKSTVITASFDMTAPNYFANVFNTDPHKIEEEGHLLYGHYDVYPDLAAVTGSGVVKAGEYSKGIKELGLQTMEDIALLLTSSVARGATASNKPVYEDFADRFTHAKSPFVISQALGGSAKNLFRVHMLSAGAGVSDKYKFSVENIRKSSSTVNQYGTFDLIVRKFDDTDEEPRVLESFRGLSLDPGSDRYVARMIGDQHIFYNFDVAENSQKILVEGDHPVRSRFIRVEMSADVANKNIDATALPFGFRGPDHLVTSGSLLSNEPDTKVYASSTAVQSITEPPTQYRKTIAVGTGLKKKSDARFYWGINTVRQTSATQPNLPNLFDNSFKTRVKHFPTHRKGFPNFSAGNNAGVADVNGTVLDSDRFNNSKFTLENISVRTGSDGLADADFWMSASYKRAGNISVDHTLKTRAFSVDDLGKVSNVKFAKFTFFTQGGFDGVNIFDEEKSRLSNTAVYREVANDEGSAGVDNNTVAAYRKATKIMSSKTDVDIQLLTIPGIRHASVSDFAIQKVQDRFDALYIMDIEERDQFNTIITSSVQKPHVSNTVSAFKNRALDNSFAAAYFPDVVVTDPDTRTFVQVPPSVAVLGAYSLNDRVAHPWFAPAGFTRGALSTVELASVRLNRTNLDDLYEADINPIAEFPGVGITIWGQKTLQAANSALDRINVRRLLIDVRRKVRRIANSLLFEPNREETLERFTSLVNPILQRIQEQSGVERFKAVIDTSTTTQADVENNTIRGKIFLQPTRSVEFVALDFVVTNAGSNI